MKKQSLLLITGGILALASCNTNTGNADDAQATIDSMVNERVEQIRMELEAKNDSLIMEMAIFRADSIMAASKGKTVKRTAPKPQPKRADVTNASNDNGSMSSGEKKESSSSSKWNDNNSGSSSKSKFDDNSENKSGSSSKSKWD